MSIVGSGQAFSQNVTLPQPPDAVQQQLFLGLTGLQGVTPVNAGPGTIMVNRRYLPTWAIVLAVIGFFFFFLGLLFLLVRNTDTLQIRISEAPGGGSAVSINGVADSETITRLQGVMMGGQPVGWQGQGFAGQPPLAQPYAGQLPQAQGYAGQAPQGQAYGAQPPQAQAYAVPSQGEDYPGQTSAASPYPAAGQVPQSQFYAGQTPAAAATPSPAAASPQLSPDGNYWWDGTQWVPTNRPAMG